MPATAIQAFSTAFLDATVSAANDPLGRVVGDMVEGMIDGEGPVQNQDGRLTVTIADASYDRVETQVNITDMSGSNITSGGNIIVDAFNDITVECPVNVL